MEELDVALIMHLEDEQSSEEQNRSEEKELLKNWSSEGAFQILVLRHLHCNEEKFRQYFRLTPVLFDYVLNNIGMNYIQTVQQAQKAYMPRRKVMHSCEVSSVNQDVIFSVLY
ncbi:hypothetical protein TNIN_262661 [Trichonephila inaurata madagascariensis]|uniref:Uncharacterized protein n=1 Tax=Trichonephila inaurata madagascariensis TaxID=2747483 RepID=A0A8X7BVS4_9ARAC|nr:hypothetical protein TNIN_262661 [Trichonephila inaurata madagascariensis]